MARRALVVVDYQNIHLTAHGLWCPAGSPAHECLIHPVQFAERLIATRNTVRELAFERNGGTYEELELAQVHSFRGQPSNEREPKAYQRSQRQRSEWTRDRRSRVTYRTLKYHHEGSRFTAREKGIDVMVALELVLAAARKTFDAVILACHDTDIEPALQVAGSTSTPVETAGWLGCKRLTVSGRTFWHTALDERAFIASQDRRDYA